MTGAHEPPLAGLRVLELGKMLAGPYASMVLGDLGAHVIKVEQPGQGDLTRRMVRPLVPGGEDAAYFASVNRGKRSIVVDLTSPRGRDLVLELAANADVILDNYRVGVRDRFGLDDETLHRANPRLIVCSISAFGAAGPYRERPGVDLNVQALSGAMYLTGDGTGGPMRLGVPMADLAGGVFSVIGILAALYRRGSAGVGATVDIGLLDSLVSFLTYMAANYSATGVEPPPVGSGHHSVVPYQAFPTADGWIVVACLSERFWPPLCAALGRDDLAADERFATNTARVERRDELVATLSATLAEQDKATWLERLAAAGVPAAPIQRLGEVLADPHLRARTMVTPASAADGGSVEVVGNPVKLDDVAEPVEREYPLLAEHTTEVLRDLLGYDDEAIGRLHDSGVVHCREREDRQ